MTPAQRRATRQDRDSRQCRAPAKRPGARPHLPGKGALTVPRRGPVASARLRVGQHHTPQRGAAPTSPPEQVGSRVPRGTQVSGVGGRPPATSRTRETSARVRKRHAHPEMPGASSRLRSRRAAPGNAPAGRREQVRAGASRCQQVRALGRADMKRLRQELGSRKQSQVEGSPAKSAMIEHAGRGRGGCRTGRQARETPRKRPRGRRAKDRQCLGALPGGTRGSRPCPRSPSGSGDAGLETDLGK